jgi:inositol hexakisphosphate/diphosphoinositol-pentakisphosphate kinase
MCDCLLSWHSDGFPLKKAQQYVQMRRPFLVNDVHMQDNLLDRRKVYKMLQVGGWGKGCSAAGVHLRHAGQWW